MKIDLRHRAGIDSPSWKGGKPNCIDCGKKVTKYTAIRCRTCNLHFHSGENSYKWKGGLRGIDYIERRKFQHNIQKLVFERDDYTCQICRIKGVYLQVDHIQSWSEYVELRFSMDNCRTLCMDCHYKITFSRPKPKNIIWGHNFKKARIAT